MIWPPWASRWAASPQLRRGSLAPCTSHNRSPPPSAAAVRLLDARPPPHHYHSECVSLLLATMAFSPPCCLHPCHPARPSAQTAGALRGGGAAAPPTRAAVSPPRRRPLLRTLVTATANEVPPASSQPLGGAPKRGVAPEGDAAAASAAAATPAAAADADATATATPCSYCGGSGQVTCPVCDGEGVLGRTIGCRYCRGACTLKCPLCAVADMYKWTYDEAEEGAAREGAAATEGGGGALPLLLSPSPGATPTRRR